MQRRKPFALTDAVAVPAASNCRLHSSASESALIKEALWSSSPRRCHTSDCPTTAQRPVPIPLHGRATAQRQHQRQRRWQQSEAPLAWGRQRPTNSSVVCGRNARPCGGTIARHALSAARGAPRGHCHARDGVATKLDGRHGRRGCRSRRRVDEHSCERGGASGVAPHACIHVWGWGSFDHGGTCWGRRVAHGCLEMVIEMVYGPYRLVGWHEYRQTPYRVAHTAARRAIRKVTSVGHASLHTAAPTEHHSVRVAAPEHLRKPTAQQMGVGWAVPGQPSCSAFCCAATISDNHPTLAVWLGPRIDEATTSGGNARTANRTNKHGSSDEQWALSLIVEQNREQLSWQLVRNKPTSHWLKIKTDWNGLF